MVFQVRKGKRRDATLMNCDRTIQNLRPWNGFNDCRVADKQDPIPSFPQSSGLPSGLGATARRTRIQARSSPPPGTIHHPHGKSNRSGTLSGPRWGILKPMAGASDSRRASLRRAQPMGFGPLPPPHRRFSTRRRQEAHLPAASSMTRRSPVLPDRVTP